MARAEALTVRSGNPTDGPAVGTIFARACRVAYTDILPAWFIARYEPDRQARVWTARIEALPADRAVLVAEVGKSTVGFVHIGPEEEPRPGEPAGEILHLFVDPGAVRCGAGRALLSAARRWFAGHDRPRATLWVFGDNAPARAFYEAVGWADTGESRPEPFFAAQGADIVECRYEVGTSGDRG